MLKTKRTKKEIVAKESNVTSRPIPEDEETTFDSLCEDVFHDESSIHCEKRKNPSVSSPLIAPASASASSIDAHVEGFCLADLDGMVDPKQETLLAVNSLPKTHAPPRSVQ